MNLTSQIQKNELKLVALAKAQSEIEQELGKIKKLSTCPAPFRRKLKDRRTQEIENFYTNRKIK